MVRGLEELKSMETEAARSNERHGLWSTLSMFGSLLAPAARAPQCRLLRRIRPPVLTLALPLHSRRATHSGPGRGTHRSQSRMRIAGTEFDVTQDSAACVTNGSAVRIRPCGFLPHCAAPAILAAASYVNR